MNKLTTISHVCSLGSLFQSFQLLKEAGLKQESYQFDWIFSNITNTENIPEDDF